MAASRQFLLKCSLVLQISLLAGGAASTAQAEDLRIDVPQPAKQCSEAFINESNEGSRSVVRSSELNASMELKIEHSRVFIDYLNAAHIADVYVFSTYFDSHTDLSVIKRMYDLFPNEQDISHIIEALSTEKGRRIFKNLVSVNSDSSRILLQRVDSAVKFLRYIWNLCPDNYCREKYYSLIMPQYFTRPPNGDSSYIIFVENILKSVIEDDVAGRSSQKHKIYESTKIRSVMMDAPQLQRFVEGRLGEIRDSIQNVQLISRKDSPLSKDDLNQIQILAKRLDVATKDDSLAVMVAKASRMAYLFEDKSFLHSLQEIMAPLMSDLASIHNVLQVNKKALDLSETYFESHRILSWEFKNLTISLSKYLEKPKDSQLPVVLTQPGHSIDDQLISSSKLTIWQKMAKLARQMVGISEWEYKAAPLAPLDLKKLYDERAIALENIGSYKFNLGRKDLTEAQLFEESMKVSYTELLLSTHANLISQSVQDRLQQLSQLNNRIMKNRGPADRLISASVVSQVQKDLLDLTQKIDQLYSKYVALGKKKEQFVRELVYEMRLSEERLRAELGVSSSRDFMTLLKEIGQQPTGSLKLKNRQTEIELYLEMQKVLADAQASFANFNMTVQGVSMAKQTVKMLNNYCRDIVRGLTAQNVAGLAGTTGINANNLKELAEKNRNLFEQSGSQTRVLETRK